ncbi:MAG: SAP domain-containing protein [Clostridia bacterium]|nr:SAP domain-containing protein [Clostridia bacterium]
MKELSKKILKIIKTFCGVIFSLCAVASVGLLFDKEASGATIPALLLIGICGYLAYICLKKPKKPEPVIRNVYANKEDFSKGIPLESEKARNQKVTLPVQQKNHSSIYSSTNRIIEETDFSKATSIDELNQLSMLRSDKLYEDRQKRIASFDPYEAIKLNIPPKPLDSVKKNFLKQIAGQPIDNPNVWGYWTYEYSLDFSKVMTELLSMHYLSVVGKDKILPKLTTPELKRILSDFNLKVSGKKADLLNRIETNIDPYDLEEYFSEDAKFYYLTERGEEALQNLSDSATKDTDFEDECLNLIINGDVNSAYKHICKHEMKKVIPRGLGIDWSEELNNGLSDYQISEYTHFLEADIELPDELLEFEIQFKACCILCIMLGMQALKISKTFRRITGAYNISNGVLNSNLQKYQFELLDGF